MKKLNKEKILKAHSVNTLRKMSKECFGVNIWYYYNNVEVDVDFDNTLNPVCGMLNANNTGNKICKKNLCNNLKSLQKGKNEITFKCFAGFLVKVIPLFNNHKYLGALIASGIWLSPYDRNMKPYIEKLSKMGFCKKDVTLNYKKLMPLNKYNLENMSRLLQIVSDDIVDLDNTLSAKAVATKKQSAFVEKAQNNNYKAIVSRNKKIKDILDTLDLIKDRNVPVLIDGETGTGKELFASAVHYNSPRKNRMFVAQSCSTFTSTILCSELFGHKKGAFTGAVSDKKGLFEIADGGTLFLDEIGETHIDSQAKLLRVIETGTSNVSCLTSAELFSV